MQTREEKSECRRRNYQEHKEERQKYGREYRQEHKEERQKYDWEHRQEHKEERRKWGRELKIEVLTRYGNGKLACVKCGFFDIRALCLDHLNGGGRKERERFPGMGFYGMLRRENFPSGYQTLCANCNLIKAIKEGELSGVSALREGAISEL